MGIPPFTKENFFKKVFFTEEIFKTEMDYQSNIVYAEVPVVDGTTKFETYYIPRITNETTGDVSKRRPGKEPSLPDSALTAEDLERRNNRRRRNREAAARVRERRLNKMSLLEKQIHELKRDQERLMNENSELKKEVAHLRSSGRQRISRQISNTELPPENELPVIPKTETEVFPATSVQSHAKTPSVLFTPGGTFVLTPVQQNAQFNFPEVKRNRSVSDGEYNKILLNL